MANMKDAWVVVMTVEAEETDFSRSMTEWVDRITRTHSLVGVKPSYTDTIGWLDRLPFSGNLMWYSTVRVGWVLDKICIRGALVLSGEQGVLSTPEKRELSALYKLEIPVFVMDSTGYCQFGGGRCIRHTLDGPAGRSHWCYENTQIGGALRANEDT